MQDGLIAYTANYLFHYCQKQGVWKQTDKFVLLKGILSVGKLKRVFQ
jgi:hypothetical protein